MYKANNSLVSIIIPVYNREDILQETIDCAINQTYTNIELIIVDNNSNDATWDIVLKAANADKRIKIFRNKKNIGPVLNWKVALDNCSGEYVKILWSDDKMSENFISDTLSLFDDNTAFVISDVVMFETNIECVLSKIHYRSKIYNAEFYLKNLLLDNFSKFMVSPGCAIFRLNDVKSSLLIDIPNGDNLDFKLYGAGNDLLISLITANKYKVIKATSNALSYFRSHSKSITIEKRHIIDLYYEWAKFYFVKKYYPEIINLYKIKILLYVFFKKQFFKLNKEFTLPISLSSFFYFIYIKIFKLKHIKDVE